jgi:hypothetical protein
MFGHIDMNKNEKWGSVQINNPADAFVGQCSGRKFDPQC